MTWEPGYREVPATDPPDYQPDDGEWQDATADYAEWPPWGDDDAVQ